MRVLLVETNPRYAATLIADLKSETIRVDVAETGDDALYLMRDFQFDLVLLDLVLPDMDGALLIRQIRTAKHDTPIIALSSVPQARLKALAAGADDVVVRDIDPAELGARIRAIVRRSRGFAKSQLQIGGLTLDVDSHDVVANGVRVHFTFKEFAILELLVLRRNMILNKETILSQIYGGMDDPEIKIIDVFICKIRSKLSKAGLPTIISTVWGRGYSVKDIGHEAPEISPVRPHPERTQLAFA
ncbi:MAG: response regulator transcription factor [Janthinobacterium lividum]